MAVALLYDPKENLDSTTIQGSNDDQFSANQINK
jgi:hypothetical protein